MKYVEIDIGGQVFRAHLLEEKAPKTCQAIWDALPFGGRSVHAMLSGDMFRMLEPAPIAMEEWESQVAFQYPGLMVYYPPLKEIAFCYGNARFRGLAHAVYVTPIGEVEGDISALAKAGAQLQRKGATPIEFRRTEGPAVAAAPPELEGTKIEVTLDDVTVTATLLEDKAPKTCAAFKKILPIEGTVTNTKWSGAMLRLWGAVGPREGIGLNLQAESGTRFHWPGYIYYYPEFDGLRICYGDASMSGAFGVENITPLARLEGDWSAFREKAGQLYLIGEKRMGFRLKE